MSFERGIPQDQSGNKRAARPTDSTRDVTKISTNCSSNLPDAASAMDFRYASPLCK